MSTWGAQVPVHVPAAGGYQEWKDGEDATEPGQVRA